MDSSHNALAPLMSSRDVNSSECVTLHLDLSRFGPFKFVARKGVAEAEGPSQQWQAKADTRATSMRNARKVAVCREAEESGSVDGQSVDKKYSPCPFYYEQDVTGEYSKNVIKDIFKVEERLIEVVYECCRSAKNYFDICFDKKEFTDHVLSALYGRAGRMPDVYKSAIKERIMFVYEYRFDDLKKDFEIVRGIIERVGEINRECENIALIKSEMQGYGKALFEDESRYSPFSFRLANYTLRKQAIIIFKLWLC